MYSSSPCQINNPDLLWDLSYGAFPIKSEICISRFIGAPWNLVCSTIPMGEGYSPEKGYGDVRPSIPPFHASPAVHKTSEINVKFCLQNQQFSENMASFSSRSSNLAQIFVKKLRNLINYQFSSPRFDESSGVNAFLTWGDDCQWHLIGKAILHACAHRGESEGGCAPLRS